MHQLSQHASADSEAHTEDPKERCCREGKRQSKLGGLHVPRADAEIARLQTVSPFASDAASPSRGSVRRQMAGKITKRPASSLEAEILHSEEEGREFIAGPYNDTAAGKLISKIDIVEEKQEG